MNPHACFGVTNPNSFFDAKTVREIRLLHLCDKVSASQIARDLGVNVSCISRIVNWKAWARQDEDLRVIPKPGHKGGDPYHQPKREMNTGIGTLEPMQRAFYKELHGRGHVRGCGIVREAFFLIFNLIFDILRGKPRGNP